MGVVIDKQNSGASLIYNERARQVQEEGYTAEHDAGHAEQLMQAADCYTQYAILRIRYPYAAPELFGDPSQPYGGVPRMWPWGSEFWKPSENQLENLVRAGALIAAAIDSLQGVDIDGNEVPRLEEQGS